MTNVSATVISGSNDVRIAWTHPETNSWHLDTDFYVVQWGQRVAAFVPLLEEENRTYVDKVRTQV